MPPGGCGKSTGIFNMGKFKLFLFALLGLLGFAAAAHAELPTEITTMQTDVSTMWTWAKGVIVGVVVFGIIIAYAKKAKHN